MPGHFPVQQQQHPAETPKSTFIPSFLHIDSSEKFVKNNQISRDEKKGSLFKL
jgi:hypothetical protein